MGVIVYTLNCSCLHKDFSGALQSLIGNLTLLGTWHYLFLKMI